MKLIIDIATTRKDGKLHLDNRVLTFCDEFKALPETEALAILATIQNDLAIMVKRGESILTKKAGLN